MALQLTMAFSDNPRVQPLKDGTVKPQNIDLECITLDPSALFQRNLLYDEFDVSEMSISETLLAMGEARWQQVGLVGPAGVLEPRACLAHALCQHRLRHHQSRHTSRASALVYPIMI